METNRGRETKINSERQRERRRERHQNGKREMETERQRQRDCKSQRNELLSQKMLKGKT